MESVDPFKPLEDTLLAASQSLIDPGAWGLILVLRRGLRFAQVDDKAREIVLDYRALMLGIVTVGHDEGYRSSYQNTATWFVDWLRPELPSTPPISSVLDKALTPESELLRAFAERYQVVPSRSVATLLGRAVDYAKQTMNRPRAGLRHLLLALLTNTGQAFVITEFKWTLTPAKRGFLSGHLLAQIERDPEAGEKLDVWRRLLGEPASAQDAEAPAAPAFFVSGFDADRTSDDSDPLQTNADVVAMARLICHEDADPPISIGVFGGWGSGKSTFMEALQRQVAELAHPSAAAGQPADGPHFVSPIVQIRFNAWQFADANLWASITAEFFDQLRAGGFEGGGKRAHARLIEDVNKHVRGLSREAAMRRSALARADEELRAAQVAHDEAVDDRNQGLRQAMISGLAEAYDRNRVDLVRSGLIDPKSHDQLAEFIGLAKDVRTQWGQLRRIASILGAQWRLLVAIGVIALVLAIAVLAATDWAPAGALTAFATAVAGLTPLVRRGAAVLREVIRQTGPFADGIEEAEKAGLKNVLTKEVALRSAAEEAEALRETSERADRALARYVDPAARSNPPRVLRYLLEDDPDTRAFEQEIGLIGRARRLFQALDQIVGHNRDMKERLRALAPSPAHLLRDSEWEERSALEKEIDEEMPDRIILYIDDLDRCTHDQVYKVLQAVHLLLAFKLFVVVVAVDMEWVEAAVARSIEFAGRESEKEEVKDKARRERAIEYLSKIFQLPFWLKPFAGDEHDRYAGYVRSLTRAPRQAPPPPAGPQPPVPREGGSDGAGKVGTGPAPPPSLRPAEGGTHDSDQAGGTGSPESVAEAVARALKTLQLDGAEEDFLAGPEISALAATDPRGVKRLVNVYKIARARLSETDDAMILGGPARPPAYPLIAVCAAIETGQPLEVADKFYDALKRQSADFGATDAIKVAIAAAVTERDGRPASAKDYLHVARVVRRYSFNRFH